MEWVRKTTEGPGRQECTGGSSSESEDNGVRDDMVALLPRVDSSMAIAVTQNDTDPDNEKQ